MFESFFVRAKELQRERLRNIFKTGFKLPEDISRKYFLCYQAYKASGNSEDQDTYKFLFEEFWKEIRDKISIPNELNNLDRATLFGRVCLGEHIAD